MESLKEIYLRIGSLGDILERLLKSIDAISVQSMEIWYYEKCLYWACLIACIVIYQISYGQTISFKVGTNFNPLTPRRTLVSPFTEIPILF